MENPSLVILKHEDWPGLDKITTLRGWEKDGSMRRISILVGNNGLFLDFELDRGVDGANTGYAFPDMLVEAVKLSKAGKRDEAHDLFDAHLPLLRYDHQPGVGLAVRKYVLQRRGVLSSAAMRKPAPAFSAADPRRSGLPAGAAGQARPARQGLTQARQLERRRPTACGSIWAPACP